CATASSASDLPVETAANAARPSRILVAEDNRINQIIVSECLRAQGYMVDIVPDGKQAVDAVRNGAYDLILMDCQMPEMDGFEATREIRRLEADGNAKRRMIPVVALTANAIKGDRERCLEAGMNDYVTKPINQQALMTAIARQLRSRENHDQSPRQHAKSEDHPLAPFDVSVLVERCMGNLDSAAQVLDEFERQVKDDLQKIEQGLARFDAHDVAAVAHALKGAAGMLSAEQLTDNASKLEQLGQEQNLSEATQLLESLHEQVQRCLAYLPEARKQIT